jgi:hypothetical protein
MHIFSLFVKSARRTLYNPETDLISSLRRPLVAAARSMSASFLPMSEQMLSSSLDTYGTVAKAVGGVALAIFTARLSLSAALISSPGAYGAALKDLLVFFVALALAPLVFKGIVLTSSSIAEHLRVPETVAKSGGLMDQFSELITEEFPWAGFITNFIPLTIRFLASAVYSVLLGTLLAIAPFIFLHQLVSHQSAAISTLLGSVVALSSWPILWNAMGLLAHNLWPSYSETSVSGACFNLVVRLLQILSPLFSAMLIKSFSMAGAGKSVTIVKSIRNVNVKSRTRSRGNG